MKFRDPKTGVVFNGIVEAVLNFRCPGMCVDCPLFPKVHGYRECHDGFWWVDHPAEAARLMGYEVIEDNCLESEAIKGAEIDPVKEVNMEKKDKPRLAEVLGVDVGEKFRVHPCSCYFWIRPDGDPTSDKPGLEKVQELGWILNAINHPESIIRGPRLTEAELERCWVYGAKWVSKEDVGMHALRLWDKKPKLVNGFYWHDDATPLATVAESLFPSVRPGDCICVEEAGGDGR